MKRAFVLGVAALVIAVGAETILASVQGEQPRMQAHPIHPIQKPPRPLPDEAEVKRTESIPTGYKTYSLFLVCNPQWLEQRQGESSGRLDDLFQKFDRLNDLYEKFDNFGRTIGNDNLAVWFWVDKANPLLVHKNVDVERSIRFCQAWKLKPSAGPHIVVTAAYPYESPLSSGLPKDSAVFELGNMGSKQISQLLAKLTDELIEKGHVESSGKPQETKWVRLLGAVQQSINKFGCAWSFKIDAGPVKADLHSCKS